MVPRDIYATLMASISAVRAVFDEDPASNDRERAADAENYRRLHEAAAWLDANSESLDAWTKRTTDTR